MNDINTILTEDEIAELQMLASEKGHLYFIQIMYLLQTVYR